jgi:hypothetical protein
VGPCLVVSVVLYMEYILYMCEGGMEELREERRRVPPSQHAGEMLNSMLEAASVPSEGKSPQIARRERKRKRDALCMLQERQRKDSWE